MFLLVVVTALFCGTNAEFLSTANEQYKQVIEAVKDGVHKPFATESMTSFPGSASQDTPQFEDLYESDGFTDPSPNIHA